LVTVVFGELKINGERTEQYRGVVSRGHFDRDVIILCVGWYLRYKLSFRDLVASHEVLVE
jgi:transposase-like protein